MNVYFESLRAALLLLVCVALSAGALAATPKTTAKANAKTAGKTAKAGATGSKSDKESAAKADAAAKAPDKFAPPPIEVVSLLEPPKATFAIDGRNPFFPEKTDARRRERPVSATNMVATASSFVINGITSRPKPTVIINHRTFEPGEEGEVKVSGGTRVLIKCLEIKDDGAIILVDKQQRQELKVQLF